MTSIRFFIFSFLLCSFNSENTSFCQNFKKGSFDVMIDGESDIYFRIERTEESQVETNIYDDKVYYSIQWMNDCSYIQKFDKSKMKLTDEMRMINKDGGIVVELLEVQNDTCISYQSYVKKFKNLSLKKGLFCQRK